MNFRSIYLLIHFRISNNKPMLPGLTSKLGCSPFKIGCSVISIYTNPFSYSVLLKPTGLSCTLFKVLFIFESNTEREGGKWRGKKERASRGGAESRRERIPSGLHTDSLNPPTVRSWPEPNSRVRCLTNWATQEPYLAL